MGQVPPWSDSTVDEHIMRRQPQAYAPPTVEQRYAAYIRREAIERMTVMNTRQAEEAWRRRRKDPLEPHGIAMLYVVDNPRKQWSRQVVAGTRLWIADGHGWDVHQRVFRFYHDVCQELPGLGGDVRRLADRCDDAMTDTAQFIGVAVSSMDTSTGTWAEVVSTAQVRTTDTRSVRLWGRGDLPGAHTSEFRPVGEARDLPGSIRIVLTDATMIVVERRGAHDFDHRIITSTATLNYDPANSPYPWGWATSELLTDDSEHSEVLRWLTALCELCEQMDTARIDALHRGGRS